MKITHYKLLLFVLLIVGVVAQEYEMDALEQQMLYKQNDKSQLLTVIMALVHLYVGEWARGFKP